jgi:hypothetical protein
VKAITNHPNQKKPIDVKLKGEDWTAGSRVTARQRRR